MNELRLESQKIPTKKRMNARITPILYATQIKRAKHSFFFFRTVFKKTTFFRFVLVRAQFRRLSAGAASDFFFF